MFVPFCIPRNNVQIASNPHQHFIVSPFHFSHLHFQVNNNGDYIFRCFFAICMSSFVKCGCKFFAYFKTLGLSYCWILYIFIFGSVHYIFWTYALQIFSPNFLNNVSKTSSRDGAVWSHHHHPTQRNPEIKLPTSIGSYKKQESSRKTSISALLTMTKPLTVWITINCLKVFPSQKYLDFLLCYLLGLLHFCILHLGPWSISS